MNINVHFFELGSIDALIERKFSGWHSNEDTINAQKTGSAEQNSHLICVVNIY